MVEEARSREENALSLLREELQAKAAEARSLKVWSLYFILSKERKQSFSLKRMQIQIRILLFTLILIRICIQILASK
jgi:hypothetical protein